MTKTPLLKDYIKRSGYKITHLAQQLGITEHSMSRKINGKNEFKASEIDVLCKLLKIGIKDRMAIFFANE